MTREEFLDTVAKFGLAHTEYNDFIEVKIKSSYGKPITIMKYCWNLNVSYRDNPDLVLKKLKTEKREALAAGDFE